MYTIVANVSGGYLALDSLRYIMTPGESMDFPYSLSDLLNVCPELSGYKDRGRVMITEASEESSNEEH